MADFSEEFEKTITKLGKDVQSFVERISDEFQQENVFSPAVDVIESEETFRLVMDIPGLSKEEISLSLKNGVLTISGERAVEEAENGTYKKRERVFGAFSRSFALPDDVNSAEIKANFKNGVLTVTLPKSTVLKDSTNIKID
ncbi:Hsp20/alpha crystallin family protein [bacterium]|nr:MAG: Hsp20/alpha crystallin family protein [bacterium]